MPDSSPIKVLVTGAYGLIGNLVYSRLLSQPEMYDVYGMSRTLKQSQRTEGIEVCPVEESRLRVGDLTDFDSVRRAVEGMDVVVHMAADPAGMNWESVLNNNMVGSYHIFEASRLAGVKRVLYASSNQVVFGYGQEEPFKSLFHGEFEAVDPQALTPIDHLQPTRPLNLYACGKVFGEALAHMYAYKMGMSCLVLRIGWVLGDDRPPTKWGRAVWCSQRDVVQLVEKAIQAPPELKYDVFFGHSDNLYNMVDLSHAKQVLGYSPQDRVEDTLS
jgi:NAD+ dependent glucose-6-phosphate dehydrogenase